MAARSHGGRGPMGVPDSGDDVSLRVVLPTLHRRTYKGQIATLSIVILFPFVCPWIDLCMHLLLCQSHLPLHPLALDLHLPISGIPRFAIWIRLLPLPVSRPLTSRADSASSPTHLAPPKVLPHTRWPRPFSTLVHMLCQHRSQAGDDAQTLKEGSLSVVSP